MGEVARYWGRAISCAHVIAVVGRSPVTGVGQSPVLMLLQSLVGCPLLG